jgi:cob(I)alamin adenosyltransferase
MVHLTRIYTRLGDAGTTSLGDGSRTSKTDVRLAAFADVDEANCALGVALVDGERDGSLDGDVAALLRRIQNELFDVGADLCTPMSREDGEHPPLRVRQQYVDDLETACDAYNAHLPALRSFVLPGGTVAATRLHVARTVVRRAERSTWAAVHAYGEGLDGGVDPMAAIYLNRLSDLLFILARHANRVTGDVLWSPGGGR